MFDQFYNPKSGQPNPLIITEDEGDELGYAGKVQEEILETFGLTLEQFAKICHVSPKTPYNWRKESEINRRTKGMRRLFELARIAINWRNAGFSKPDHLLEEPLLHGKSLWDLLIADTIDGEAVLFIGSRIHMGQLQNKKLADPFS